MEGTSKPDYKLCVEIVAKAGLREMIKPGLLAIFAPIVVGLIFKTLGGGEGKELLGASQNRDIIIFTKHFTSLS